MIVLDEVEWVTATEAAGEERARPGRPRQQGLLGPDVKPSRVRDWRRRGLVAGHRVGRVAYYRLDQLLDAELRTRLHATRPRMDRASGQVFEAATV